jgi:uncharacterized protein YqgC (DUF456 family)
MDARSILVTLFTALTMATGLAGCILPVVPGLGLIWLGGLVFGLVLGFGTPGLVAMAVMTVLLVLGTSAPYVLPQLAGRRTGASKRAIVAGVLLGIVGFFALPVIGAILGALLGVFATEWAIRKDRLQAWVSTKGVLVGWGLGALVQATAGFLMTCTWILWAILTLTRPAA